jgi:NhaP-type Na+/H+ and K+/H+ antiporter
MLQTANLTPRDVNNLTALKDVGLSLVEVRISQLSFVKGQLLSNVPLPAHTRLIGVLRKGRPILELEAVFLEENDTVYLLTEDEERIREVFTL